MQPPPVRSSRWGAISGIVVFVYVLVLAGAMTQINDRNRFNRWGAAMGSIGARVVLAVVVAAALFHALDGLRRLLHDAVPSLVARDAQMRAGVLFLTWALALPAAAVIVWPWIAETHEMSDSGPSASGPPLASEPPLAPRPPTVGDGEADVSSTGRGSAVVVAPDASDACGSCSALPVQVLSVFVLHDPGHYGVGLYLSRWHHSGWRLFDWLVVVLAIVHGTIGLYGRLVEGVRRPLVRDAITVVAAVALVLLLVGFSVAVLSFDATASPGRG